ncbi:unnamed protein product, partial [Mesorhabditis spiculigera]
MYFVAGILIVLLVTTLEVARAGITVDTLTNNKPHIDSGVRENLQQAVRDRLGPPAPRDPVEAGVLTKEEWDDVRFETDIFYGTLLEWCKKNGTIRDFGMDRYISSRQYEMVQAHLQAIYQGDTLPENRWRRFAHVLYNVDLGQGTSGMAWGYKCLVPELCYVMHFESHVSVLLVWLRREDYPAVNVTYAEERIPEYTSKIKTLLKEKVGGGRAPKREDLELDVVDKKVWEKDDEDRLGVTAAQAGGYAKHVTTQQHFNKEFSTSYVLFF